MANSEKKWMTTLLLSLFGLGNLGLHRFYTGHTKTGIAMLLTAGGCGFWTLYDIFMIVTKKFEDANGNIVCE
jgi:TM2 domain-containing membrane protein YozV